MKKKILIIVPSLMLGGGAEKVASTLSNELTEVYEVSIITFFHPPHIYPCSGKYYTLNESSRIKNYVNRIIRLKDLINSIAPNIIISFMNITSFWVIFVKYLYLIKIPLIISVNTNPNKHYKKKLYGKLLIKILYSRRKVDYIIPVSNGIKSIFLKYYKVPHDKIITIYNGIDKKFIEKKASEPIYDYTHIFSNKQIFKYINIARLSPEKGHKILINAYSRVVGRIPQSFLIIIGKGKLEESLKRLTKDLGLTKQVIFFGYKANPYKYLAKSDIFVLSSFHEGLPYTLIEAMACKIPIISTNCLTGPMEILKGGEYGILTEVGNSKDLANHMIKLAINSKKRKEFSLKSEERIKSFKLETFRREWISIIEKCFKKSINMD